MKRAMKAVAVVTCFMFTGCASIVSKSNWPVTVQSNPTGAKCAIAKKNGVQVHTGETPLTLTLSAKSGFFSSEDYIVSCEKEGYQTTKVDMPSSLNGWYWGNIVFGGLIGISIVDPITGAMWKLEETQVINLAMNQISQTKPVTESSALPALTSQKE